MYAIIEEGGGQRKLTEGEEILVDLLKGGECDAGEKITFDRVLVVGEEGSVPSIGQPFVDAASVTCEVVDPVVKGEKLFIHKFRPKKTYKRKTGHRQRYTSLRVTSISGG
jgi:large subunit ribosomal protein L21